MAKGDVVNEIGTVGANLTFQPASGVEVVITETFNVLGGSVGTIELYNGTNSTTINATEHVGSYKVFINNSIYLFLVGITSRYQAYCGIQTK